MIREFGEFLPDLGALGNPGIISALNILPIGGSYKPLPDLSSISGGAQLTEEPLSAAGFLSPDGTAQNFVGSETKLWRALATQAEDVTKSGGYTTAGGDVWSFAQFGANVYASNYTDPIQTYDLSSGGDFANLAASAPKAKYIAAVGDFLMLANTDDSTDGKVNYRVWWSPINNPAGTWTPSQTTQCDYQDIPGMGKITGLIGFENRAVVLLSKGLVSLVYEGTPIIFRKLDLGKIAGCEIPGSIAVQGNFIYYYGFGTFWRFDGSNAVDIGHGKVAKYFQQNLDTFYLHKVQAATDEAAGLVIWNFPGPSNSAGCPNRQLFYNYKEDRWTEGDVENCLAFEGEKPGLLLDEISGSIDEISASLDGSLFAGGGKKIYFFDASFRFASFSGNARTSTIETGDIQAIEGKSAFVDLVTPLIDRASSVTVACATKNKPSDTASYGSAVGLNSEGRAEISKSARFHRYKFVNTDVDWLDARGYEVIYVADGEV